MIQESEVREILKCDTQYLKVAVDSGELTVVTQNGLRMYNPDEVNSLRDRVTLMKSYRDMTGAEARPSRTFDGD